MKNTVRPIHDAYQRVVDFVVEHECEKCKKRRKKIRAMVDRAKRDLLRRRPGK